MRRGCARSLLAKLAADRVDGVLRHQPVGRQFAAGDRQEAADAVPLAVVEQCVGARYVARGRDAAILSVLEQRPHTGPYA